LAKFVKGDVVMTNNLLEIENKQYIQTAYRKFLGEQEMMTSDFST